MTIASDSLVSVQAYLRRRGWVEEPPGRAGSWWHRPSRRSSEETHIGVPDRIGVPGRIIPGTVEWRSVIGSLADYEKRSFEEIAETIRVQFVDVTEFGIAGDFTMAGPILLSAGASFLSSARGMLRAAATAAVRPRADIGNFSTIANRIADQARLGYTRAGSYVIPLLMPLPPPQDDSARQPLEGMGTERVAYEPAERRVTRTLAQSLAAVQQGIVQPAREPHARDMAALVSAGVTRQLVAAASSILAEPEVSEFGVSFQWAGAITPPGGVPRRVEFPAAAGLLLARAEELLKSSRSDPRQVVTGPIVMVRHLPDAPSVEIAIQTMRAGKMSEVIVYLSAQRREDALEWMRGGRAVVAEGQLVRVPGQHSRIPEPSRIHPLDETFLFEGEH